MKTLNLQQAAEFLLMHPETLRKQAKNGQVPARKVGKHWVFIEEHLADWVSGKWQMPPVTTAFKVIHGGKAKADAIDKKPTSQGYAEALGLKAKK